MHLLVLTARTDPAAAASPLAEAYDDGLVRELTALGHDVHVEDVTRPEDTDLLATMRHAAEAGRQTLARMPDAPDVVLCDGVVSAVAGHAVAAATQARVVVWTGSTDLPREPELHRLAVAVLRSATAVLASSHGVAEDLADRRVVRGIHVVPPAVDTTVFDEPAWSGREELGAPVVRVVGPDAKDVAEPLAAELPELHVEAVDTAPGTAPAAACLRERLRGASVVVTGTGPDGGRATLRAMACGLAVVALDRLPDSEILLDGASGLVIRRRDELALTVGALARDAFRREALAQGALDRVSGAHDAASAAARLHSFLAREPAAVAGY